MTYHINLTRDGDSILGTLHAEDGTWLSQSRSVNRSNVLRELTRIGIALLRLTGRSGDVVLRQDVEGSVVQ